MKYTYIVVPMMVGLLSTPALFAQGAPARPQDPAPLSQEPVPVLVKATVAPPQGNGVSAGERSTLKWMEQMQREKAVRDMQIKDAAAARPASAAIPPIMDGLPTQPVAGGALAGRVTPAAAHVDSAPVPRKDSIDSYRVLAVLNFGGNAVAEIKGEDMTLEVRLGDRVKDWTVTKIASGEVLVSRTETVTKAVKGKVKDITEVTSTRALQPYVQEQERPALPAAVPPPIAVPGDSTSIKPMTIAK